MKFSCLKENLLHGINLVGHLSLKTSSLPILSNVLFRVENNILTLTATNLEAGIYHEVRGRAEEDGECLVPARLLLDLAPLLPNDTITINTNNEGLIIGAKNLSTTLRTASITDFPIIPTIDKQIYNLSIKTPQLISALDKTGFAMSKDGHRPQFSGALFAVDEQNKQALIVATTDGYRLSEVILPLDKAVKPLKLIVPATTIHEIRRILSQNETTEIVEIQATDNQINFIAGASQIISRLIDGEYPDYQPLFPTKPLTVCDAPKNDLSRAIKAASLFSRAGIFDVSLSATPNRPIEISSENASVGAHRTTVEVKCTGNKVVITVNARYLLDGLGAVAGDTVKLSFTGTDRPILIESSKNDEVRFRHLVVPIKQS